MRQKSLQTTTMPQNGQSHTGGQLETGFSTLNPNWITTWTQPASAKGNGHLGVEAILPPGRWTWIVQLYHKQGGGKHVATMSGSTVPTNFVTPPMPDLRDFAAVQRYLEFFNQEFGKVAKPVGTVNVITEPGGTGSFQNYTDGGYQHPTLTFDLPEPRKVILSLTYTGLHYIWTGATNLTCTSTKRPFYIIKHAAQNIGLVNQAIAQGANAVEFDIQPDGNRFFVKHPFPSPLEVGDAKTDTDYFPAFLGHLNGALRSGRLANLIFDCKKPETPSYPANLIRMIRESGIPEFACTLSIPKALAGAFIAAARGMGFNCHFDSYLESSPRTAQEYIAGVEALGTDFQGMGHDPFGRAPFWQWLPWIMELTNARDSNRRYKKAYFWTVDDMVSLRNCLDYGVDGIITNKPDLLRAVLNEAPYRDLLQLATLEDTRDLRVHGFEQAGPPRPLPPLPIPEPAPVPVPIPDGSGQKRVFSYTGADQSFVVPTGVTKLNVKLWGAGGGQNGGSGAFITGELPVTPGETLVMVVGQGGQIAGLGETTIAAYGGGGTSTGDSAFKGGGGGGYTAIRRPGSFDNVVIAGSGGGGQFWGGGGGGITAGLKGNGNNSAGGEPGTQTAGGMAGGGARGGSAGRNLVGGNATGDSNASSGGGGSGFFGGAGGGSGDDNGGGGGGSSRTNQLTNAGGEPGKNGNNNTSTTVVTTAPVTPGGAADKDYVTGVGQGGANNQVGGNGLIVLSY